MSFFSPKITTLLLAASTGSIGSVFASKDPDQISFSKEIRPIPSANCFKYHGPDDGKDEHGKPSRKAGLRLDTPEGAYALKKGTAAIVPNSLENSEAWQRIIDKDDPMPPIGGHGKPLPK